MAHEPKRAQARQGRADEIEAHLHGTEASVSLAHHGLHHGLAAVHDRARDDRHHNAQRENGHAADKPQPRGDITRRRSGAEQCHEGVNAHAEEHRDGNLPQVNQAKLPAKKGDLHQHEKALPPQHECAEAHGREPEGEHIGRGGDGRVAQIGLHDDIDAKPHDRDAR